MVDSFRGERRELNAEIDRLRGVISRLKPSTADAGVQCDGAQTTDAGAQCDTAQTTDAGAQCDVTRESRTLVVAAEKRLEQVTHTAQERHVRLKALHAKLESVGFNKSSNGVWDLDTYANLRDRAQRLKSANDEKDSANRTLKDEIDGLKQKIQRDAQPYHEQRIASTMLAKKSVWERSTGHIVDSYAECPVCERCSQMLTFSLTFCSAALAISVLWRLPHKCLTNASQMPHKC